MVVRAKDLIKFSLTTTSIGLLVAGDAGSCSNSNATQDQRLMRLVALSALQKRKIPCVSPPRRPRPDFKGWASRGLTLGRLLQPKEKPSSGSQTQSP